MNEWLVNYIFPLYTFPLDTSLLYLSKFFWYQYFTIYFSDKFLLSLLTFSQI